MLKKKFLVVLIGLLIFPNVCLANNIRNISYIFYTEITKQGTINTQKLIQGKELQNWPSSEYDVQPNVFDIVVEYQNLSLFSLKKAKLHIEFWLAESPEIFNNDDALDIEKMEPLKKWVKNWEKDYTLQNLKPFESRKIVIERVRIMELIRTENINKQVIIMGWNCKATLEKSKMEKSFERSFLD